MPSLSRSALAALSALVGCLPPALAVPANPPQHTRLVYRWTRAAPLRYLLKADLKGSLPLPQLQAREPIDLDATLRIEYVVTPTSVAADGSATLSLRVISAEAEVAKIPMPIPMDDVRKMLDRTIRLASSGATISSGQTPEMPFTVTVPGVDPQRLYALLYPIAFPDRPVSVGANWTYKSDLLGSDASPARFSATLLPWRDPSAATSGALRPRTSGRWARLKEVCSMEIDQSLGAGGKPAEAGDPIAKTRTGRVDGDGVFLLNRSAGRIEYGRLALRADLVERVVGTPSSPDDPPEVKSHVEADIRMWLVAPSRRGLTAASAKSRKRR